MKDWLIAAIILGIGAFVFLILILRSYWLQSGRNIKDYQEGRDKLTFRKPKEEKVEGGGFSLANVIGSFIVILVGLSLLPVVVEAVNGACTTGSMSANVTSPNDVMICGGEFTSIVTIFFALAILSAAGASLWMATSSLRDTGLV